MWQRTFWRINSEFNIKATAYDRWNAAGIITELAKEGLENFTPFGQGFGSISQPAKEIYALTKTTHPRC